MKELVVYIRGNYCPDVRRTREFLEKHSIPHRLIDANEDPAARERVVGWTGYLSFPTLVITDGDSLEPCEPPLPLKPGQSPRNVDRGTMLTEAGAPALEAFLRRHGLLN
ncbi:MAG: glutaredoxin family protein [Anaerolineae bacterium]